MINKKNIANKKTVSKTNDKRSELLIKVDGLLEELDNDYGPFLLGELNKRLEKTIEDFFAFVNEIQKLAIFLPIKWQLFF